VVAVDLPVDAEATEVEGRAVGRRQDGRRVEDGHVASRFEKKKGSAREDTGTPG
jgi:hypothetical protein